MNNGQLRKTTSWRFRAGTRKTKRHGLVKGYVNKPCRPIPCPPWQTMHVAMQAATMSLDDVATALVGLVAREEMKK